jgi:hypothetical protein
MGKFEEMLKRLAQVAAGESEGNSAKVLEHEDAMDTIIDFQPIKDLKPGDTVRHKSCFPNLMRGHKSNPVLTVHSVGNWPTLPNHETNRRKVYDFTFVEIDTADGELIEWYAESRLYERV